MDWYLKFTQGNGGLSMAFLSSQATLNNKNAYQIQMTPTVPRGPYPPHTRGVLDKRVCHIR